jgi:hypothetical protein
MIGAIITHVRYHDGAKYVLATSIYLALAAFVAWGRSIMIKHFDAGPSCADRCQLGIVTCRAKGARIE